uniref:Uncharacterized protein n=1 Tax=Ralstonia solanacearum TaxID=305 RepID=A0A0S4UQP2_RALSL|nr:protein of unknown function [Ralstonia solanacearum]CUV35106.1 protein of unknown function [Ralstonia solanacearum]
MPSLRAQWFSMPSLSTLRAELWVQRIRTLVVMRARRRTAGNRRQCACRDRQRGHVQGSASWVSPSAFAADGTEFRASLALAAVLGQETQQAVHMVERGAVDQVTAISLLRHKRGMHQFLEVERQRRAGHVELLGDGAGRQSRRAGHHQHPEDPQTQAVSKSGEGTNGISFLHISNILKLSGADKACEKLDGGASNRFRSSQAAPLSCVHAASQICEAA